MAKDRSGKQRDARRQARDANRYAERVRLETQAETERNLKGTLTADTREMLGIAVRRWRAARL